MAIRNGAFWRRRGRAALPRGRRLRALVGLAGTWLVLIGAAPLPPVAPAPVVDWLPDLAARASRGQTEDCPGTVLAAPPGLRHGGPAAYAGLAALDCVDTAWWGESLEVAEAVAIMLRFEMGHLISHPAVVEAAARKYNEFCLEGAWSARCFNGFWAYYQAILDAGDSVDRMAGFGQERYFGFYMQVAQRVIANPGLGGQVGHANRPSEWVVILEETATEPVWKWAQGLRVGSADNQVFFRSDYAEPIRMGPAQQVASRRVVLVLSFKQLAAESSPCRPAGLGCNLARAPYTR